MHLLAMHVPLYLSHYRLTCLIYLSILVKNCVAAFVNRLLVSWLQVDVLHTGSYLTPDLHPLVCFIIMRNSQRSFMQRTGCSITSHSMSMKENEHGRGSLTIIKFYYNLLKMASSKENFQSLKERLSAYRQQKQNRKETEKTTDEALKTQTEQYLTDPILKTDNVSTDPIMTKTEINNSPIPSSAAPDTQQTQTKTRPSSNSWLVFGLKTLLWLLLLGFFIEIEFGVAFFISSLFYWMYSFLRGSKRDPKELSAYSVFNKNCERIDGTLAAEQFDQELRYGPTAVRR